MRIALAVEGTRGDVYPRQALGTSLLARGHEVLVLGGAGQGRAAAGRDDDRGGLAGAALPPSGGGHLSGRRGHDHDRRARGRAPDRRPHLLDQFYWARRVSLLDLGPPAIPRKRLTGQRLLDVLGMTLENETLSERVSWAPVCRRGGIQSVGSRSCSSTRRTTPPTDGDTLATLAPLGGRK